MTPHGGRVDLLALDSKGALYVIELKRDKTPRDVVAQALDYASCASGLDGEAIGDIWQAKNGVPLRGTSIAGPDYWPVPSTGRSFYEESKLLQDNQ